MDAALEPLDFDAPRFTIERPTVRYDKQGDASDVERSAAAARTFMRDITRATAVYLESCIHCGHCAEACHFYVTSGDPQYTPIWKLEPLKRVYEREAGPRPERDDERRGEPGDRGGGRGGHALGTSKRGADAEGPGLARISAAGRAHSL